LEDKSVPSPIQDKTIPGMHMYGTKGDQTVDHLIYDCVKLERERDKLIAHISREDNWPVQKSVLVNKYLQQFSQFTNSIGFEKL
jgi:hypothetical protein